MRLVLISDTHGCHEALQIPKCDILVCTGDITHAGYRDPAYVEVPQLKSFNDWVYRLKTDGRIREAVLVAGNHDRCLQTMPRESAEVLDAVTYLEDSEEKVLGVRFYGTPWTDHFYDWGFQLRSHDQAKDVFARIPDGTVTLDVLLTHGPPRGILDVNHEGQSCGSIELKQRIDALWQVGAAPKLHAFGHIHTSHGMALRNGTLHVNASSLNDRYEPTHAPIVLDLA